MSDQHETGEKIDDADEGETCRMSEWDDASKMGMK